MNARPASLQQTIWHPVASSSDLPFRHVFHGQLLGQELALWRADDGNVNVWENRCLHRGVRLSIGVNDGAELKCQYHGWRYANRTAGCTYIPAHPANAPARRITNRTFPVVERCGLIWASLHDAPEALPLEDGDWLPLRPIPVNATPAAAMAALEEASETVERLSPFAASLVLRGTDGRQATFFVQPVDSARTVIRGLVLRPAGEPLALLRRFNAILTRLRDRVEALAAAGDVPAPIEPRYEQVPVELSTMPPVSPGRSGQINALVRRKWQTSADVTALELEAVTGTLATFQPGAHIDLHLPNGLVRQYSITNGPGEWRAYTIGVRRDPQSRGGSISIADTLREGDLVAISEPRNNFPLRRDALRTVFMAGGIGITPLLAMAKALKSSGRPFAFHFFARSHAHVSFADDLAALGDAVVLHLGLDRDSTRAMVAEALGEHRRAHHLYACGPGGMIEMIRAQAGALGWPDEAVHVEFFSNTRQTNRDSAFTIELARSAMTLEVPAGRSILDVLRDSGVDVASSCEQGACGTCLAAVIDGTPDHQDVYLNATEKASMRCMMTCVSRSLTPRLVLDL